MFFSRQNSMKKGDLSGFSMDQNSWEYSDISLSVLHRNCGCSGNVTNCHFCVLCFITLICSPFYFCSAGYLMCCMFCNVHFSFSIIPLYFEKIDSSDSSESVNAFWFDAFIPSWTLIPILIWVWVWSDSDSIESINAFYDVRGNKLPSKLPEET